MRVSPLKLRPFLGSLALFISMAGSATASTTILNANFNSGTFASAGLVDFSSQRNPTLQAGLGVGGSGALDFDNNGASVTASMTIITTATFSMMGEFVPHANSFANGGAMGFGWTKAAGEFNAYSGVGTGVTAADTVLVGLARTPTNGFSLSAANGATGALNGEAGAFGNSIAALTAGNWYMLTGTVQYNSTTGTFTFVDVSLSDYGADGTTLVTANLLSGSGKSVVAPNFGSTGRAIFATNRDRGVQYTDNYSLVAVPEPSIPAFLVLGGLAMLIRRRREG